MVQYLDIGRANFSRIEQGEIYPGIFTLKTLQEKFGLNPNWVINNRGEMFFQDFDVVISDFGTYAEDVKAILDHMNKVPAFKHAVMSLFHEYKARNKDIIEAAFNQPE